MTRQAGDSVVFRIRDLPADLHEIDTWYSTPETVIWRIVPPIARDAARSTENLEILFVAGEGQKAAARRWENHPDKLIELYAAETCQPTGIPSIPYLPYLPLVGPHENKSAFFTWTDRVPKTPPEIAALIQSRREHYEKILRDNPGINFFDGPIVRVAAVEKTSKGIHFDLCAGSYFDLMIPTAEFDRPFGTPITVCGWRADCARDLMRFPVSDDRKCAAWPSRSNRG